MASASVPARADPCAPRDALEALASGTPVHVSDVSVPRREPGRSDPDGIRGSDEAGGHVSAVATWGGLDPFELNAAFPLPYLSPSSISTFLGCPEKFRQEYLQDVKRVRGSWGVSGSAFHEARHRALEWQMQNGTWYPADGLRPLYDRAWDKVVGDGETRWGTDTPEEIKEAGWRMFDLYQDELGRHVRPVAMETGVRGFVSGVPVPIYGRIDVLTANEVIDTKTGKQVFHQINPTHLVQGCIYCLLTGKPIQWHSVSQKPALDGNEDLLRLGPRPKVLHAAESYARDAYQGIAHLLATRGRDDPWPYVGVASGGCRFCPVKRYCPGVPE